MFLVKQLKHVNLKEVRNVGTVLHQINSLNRNGVHTFCVNSCANTKFTSYSGFGTNALVSAKPLNSVAIRHYYRNYEHHPSRIVRAYRKTRTWLTEHFVIAEKRMENIYSFLMLLTTAVLFVFVGWLNLQEGGEAGGLDTNKLKTIDSNDNNNVKK